MVFKTIKPEPPVKLKQEKSWSVQTIQLQAGSQIPQLELFARVESPYNATITASITADVKSLEVKEGDVIAQGQLLMKLDDAEVQLILDQRQSEVVELQALLQSEKNRHSNDLSSLKLEQSLVTIAEKKLAREEQTSQSNLTSRSSFDTQKQALQNQQLALKNRQLSVADHPARLAQLNARLKRKKALLEQATKDFQRSTILSPLNGIVLSTNVAPGERVRSGEPLLKLHSTDNVELRAQLPQKYINAVKQALAKNIPLQATVKTGSQIKSEIKVKLHRVSSAIADSGTGVDALFDVAAKDISHLIMGEVVELTFNLPKIDDVFRVPLSSIYGTNRIYRVNDNRLQAISVNKLGSRFIEGKQFFLVRSNELKTGDEIITTQLPRAIGGLKVDIRKPPAQR